jgi:hypothetical protein
MKRALPQKANLNIARIEAVRKSRVSLFNKSNKESLLYASIAEQKCWSKVA